MGCTNCGSDKTKKYDSRGNVIGTPELNQPQPNSVAQEARELTYAEFKVKRDQFRNNTTKLGNTKVAEFSEDYKRIQIDELISVYNHDEVHFKLTPSQALVALWQFAHHPEYQKVFNEFEGLREQVDTKYALLQ